MNKASPVHKFNVNRKLILTEDNLIGVGTRRSCYQFPDETSLCVKIPKLTKNGLKQQRREVKFYQQLYRRGVSTERICRYHGTVATSLGTGYVYDVIRDFDGKPSRQFNDYLTEQPHRTAEYLEILFQIETYLFSNKIVFYDVHPYNIVCQNLADGSLEPFIIDGIGDVVIFPALNYSRRLLNQKMMRRWLRMIGSMSNRFDWMDRYEFSGSRIDAPGSR